MARAQQNVCKLPHFYGPLIKTQCASSIMDLCVCVHMTHHHAIPDFYSFRRSRRRERILPLTVGASSFTPFHCIPTCTAQPKNGTECRREPQFCNLHSHMDIVTKKSCVPPLGCMRKPFSGQKKPVKLGRVIIFLTFDALDRILGFSKRGQVQVHRNLMTIFWGLQNHIKSVTFRRIVVCPTKIYA